MLRSKEVCEILGISYITLRDYVKRGYIKTVLAGGWRFREEDVDRLVGFVRVGGLCYTLGFLAGGVS
jgi:putative resolvase